MLPFGVDSDCLALDWQEMSTRRNWSRKQTGDHLGRVVPPLQNEVFATLRNFRHVSEGQRLPNLVVWR